MKRLILFAAVLSTLFFLLCFPKQAFMASAEGLELWFYTVLPSLLPFLILSDFLIHTGKIPELLRVFAPFFQKCFGLSVYGSYAFILGLFCGYPMGAKLTGDLLRDNKIDITEARYLLTFSNNASPIFISSYILLNSLKIQNTSMATFVILYSSTVITSFIFRIRYRRFSVYTTYEETSEVTLKSSLGRLIDVSIMNGFETITRLGGYIILFSIGAAMILQITGEHSVLSMLLPAFVEITTGIHQIADSSLTFPLKYMLILTFTSFGGISTIAQTKGMLSGTPLSLSVYIIGKTVNAVCTFFLVLLFFIIKII
ncbi:MAG: sporulation protein [Oliverpabstia sp.]